MTGKEWKKLCFVLNNGGVFLKQILMGKKKKKLLQCLWVPILCWLPSFPIQTQTASSLAASASWLGQDCKDPFLAGNWDGCSRQPGEGPSPLPWTGMISHQQDPLLGGLALSPLLPKSLLLCHVLQAALPLEKTDMYYGKPREKFTAAELKEMQWQLWEKKAVKQSTESGSIPDRRTKKQAKSRTCITF